MSKKLTKKEVHSRVEFITHQKVLGINILEVKMKEMAEERANEIDQKIIREIAVGLIKRRGIDFCPCCFADLPPNHPLRKNVYTKKIPKGGRR